MKPVKMTFRIVVMMALCVSSWGQSGRIDSGSVSTDKFGFYFETRLNPPVPELANVGGGIVTDAAAVVHRYMLDRGRHVYFGYDATVQNLPETNTYRVTFSPLTMTPQLAREALPDDLKNWTPLQTLPMNWGGPGPRTIRGGEVIALDLLTNSTTGQKIVEYVTIREQARPRPTFESINTPPRQFTYATGPARDARVDDMELRIQGPRLTINQKIDPSTIALNTEVSGPIVSFYVANRGLFLLSLTPRSGFRKLGEVRGSSLTFTMNNDVFNLVAGAPIAPGSAAFNLYVLHDPTWKPTYPFADTSKFILGAGENVDVIRRR